MKMTMTTDRDRPPRIAENPAIPYLYSTHSSLAHATGHHQPPPVDHDYSYSHSYSYSYSEEEAGSGREGYGYECEEYEE